MKFFDLEMDSILAKQSGSGGRRFKNLELVFCLKELGAPYKVPTQSQLCSGAPAYSAPSNGYNGPCKPVFEL
jgi:hypothetical protein